ncbi:MAG: transcriptional repressor [Candidatus Heimdallarchaeota archaeon]|nr:transcriptional repressor [Candidatus Heimdallarchaeota archaeon]MDH5646061.1 transcriptional repressor [Candidatus Heimdallarchaeota archaeon]
MYQSDEELIVLLQEKGFKVTPQRLVIYRYLVNNDSHPSADIIYSDIKKTLPTISQGTVYKTLSMLTELGIIRELKIGNGHSRYDSNTDLHINLICPDCNNITDYQSSEMESFWDNLSRDIGGEIVGQRFDVYKRCGDCGKFET